MTTGLQSFLITYLNQNFGRFDDIKLNHFPFHEFNSDESKELSRLCQNISDFGYEYVVNKIGDESFVSLLNTASEYGVFVEAGIGDSYLGIFIISQMLLEPFASNGYCEIMCRSNVYKAASEDLRKMSCFLMILATFVNDKSFKGKDSMYYINVVSDIFSSQLTRSDIEEISHKLISESTNFFTCKSSQPQPKATVSDESSPNQNEQK